MFLASPLFITADAGVLTVEWFLDASGVAGGTEAGPEEGKAEAKTESVPAKKATKKRAPSEEKLPAGVPSPESAGEKPEGKMAEPSETEKAAESTRESD